MYQLQYLYSRLTLAFTSASLRGGYLIKVQPDGLELTPCPNGQLTPGASPGYTPQLVSMAPRVKPRAPRVKPRPLTLIDSLEEEAAKEQPKQGARRVISSFKRGLCAQFTRRCNTISRKLFEYEKKNDVTSPRTAKEVRRKWITALDNWKHIEIMGNFIAKTFKAKNKVTLSLVAPCAKIAQTKNMISRAVRRYARSQGAWDPNQPGQHQALLASVSNRKPDMTGFPPSQGPSLRVPSQVEADNKEPVSQTGWEFGQVLGEPFSMTIKRMKGRVAECTTPFPTIPSLSPATMVSACIDPMLIQLMMKESLHETTEEKLVSIIEKYEKMPKLISLTEIEPSQDKEEISLASTARYNEQDEWEEGISHSERVVPIVPDGYIGDIESFRKCRKCGLEHHTSDCVIIDTLRCATCSRWDHSKDEWCDHNSDEEAEESIWEDTQQPPGERSGSPPSPGSQDTPLQALLAMARLPGGLTNREGQVLKTGNSEVHLFNAGKSSIRGSRSLAAPALPCIIRQNGKNTWGTAAHCDSGLTIPILAENMARKRGVEYEQSNIIRVWTHTDEELEIVGACWLQITTPKCPDTGRQRPPVETLVAVTNTVKDHLYLSWQTLILLCMLHPQFPKVLYFGEITDRTVILPGAAAKILTRKQQVRTNPAGELLVGVLEHHECIRQQAGKVKISLEWLEEAIEQLETLAADDNTLKITLKEAKQSTSKRMELLLSICLAKCKILQTNPAPTTP